MTPSLPTTQISRGDVPQIPTRAPRFDPTPTFRVAQVVQTTRLAGSVPVESRQPARTCRTADSMRATMAWFACPNLVLHPERVRWSKTDFGTTCLTASANTRDENR